MISVQHFKKAFSYGTLVGSTGFAMFCMFFGSGNLVFPLMVGQATQDHYLSAIAGVTITGVLLPFLGLWAILLFQGSYRQFFDRFGRKSSFLLTLFLLLLIGPLAVIPRCITVACGSFSMLFPSTSLPWFSFVFCIVIFFTILDKRKIVPLLGAVLTPILLSALALIFYYGIKISDWTPDAGAVFTFDLQPFLKGFSAGYQGMDLLASFFFASTVVVYMKNKLSHKAISLDHKNHLILASLIMGALFLWVVYIFLIYLGAAYSSLLSPETAEKSLSIIAYHTLGLYAGPVVATAICLACFTTAMVLVEVSAEFFQERIFKRKLSLFLVVILVLVLSFVCSTLKFQGIMAFLGPVLEVIYPALITFTIVNIAHKLWGFRPLKRPVYATLVVTLFMLFFGLI